MPTKRSYSRRKIKILAYYRVVKILTEFGMSYEIFMPSLPDDGYPYKTEIIMYTMAITHSIRKRYENLLSEN